MSEAAEVFDSFEFDDEPTQVRTVGRYAIIPPPDSSQERPTLPSPPDDVSLDAWCNAWNDRARHLRESLLRRAQEASASRQGMLGLTADANERTPAQAVAYLTLQLAQHLTELGRLQQQLAETFRTQQRKETLEGVT